MSSSLSNDVPLNDDAANTNTNDDEDDDSFDMSIMDPVDNEKKQLFLFMLKECLEKNNDFNIQSFMEMLQREEGCGAQDIDNCISDIFINIYYKNIKSSYDQIEMKQRMIKHKKTITAHSGEKLDTYNFKSERCHNTSFDMNFNRTSPSSMLLLISMHGTIILRDNNTKPILQTCETAILNKFGLAGTGQCTFTSKAGDIYTAHSMCEAVSNPESILDIHTILREGRTHAKMIINPELSPDQLYQTTQSVMEYQRDKGMERQEERKNRCPTRYGEVPYGELLGERTTQGTQYLEKMYDYDDITLGIIVCKDWPEIDAKCMDNLLTNSKFIYFLTGNNDANDLFDTPIFLSKIIEFCEQNGRPEISIVDNACSVFEGVDPLTVSNILAIDNHIKGSAYTNVAKGKKTKRRRRRKTHQRKTRRRPHRRKTHQRKTRRRPHKRRTIRRKDNKNK